MNPLLTKFTPEDNIKESLWVSAKGMDHMPLAKTLPSLRAVAKQSPNGCLWVSIEMLIMNWRFYLTSLKQFLIDEYTGSGQWRSRTCAGLEN